MYWVKTPSLIKNLFPSIVWDFKDRDKSLYLTFDDGPDENITPQVLYLLEKFDAKATFFCVGEKVKQNQDLYHRILKNGHSTGNHSYNHLNGLHVSTSKYLENIKLASEYIQSPLFRPPYGRMKPAQFLALKKHYRIIMWDVLTGDFDPKVTGEKVLEQTIRYAKPGSIVVFHDNAKFSAKMIFALRGTLEYFKKEGYCFKAIPMEVDEIA